MLKYYNAMVVFEEIPTEITLAINITNCPCRCKGCHSQFLWEDVGTELTTEEVDKLIEKNIGITTVCLMGGDGDTDSVKQITEYIRNKHQLKTGWYSGRDELPEKNFYKIFDYIKLGHYDNKLGGLNKRTTNQRLYKVNIDFSLEDITKLFWIK